jgi:integrase/recombinase XerC
MGEYEATLARSDLSPSTRRVYWSRVSGYLAWLVEGTYLPPAARPLDNVRARNAAVRDYRTWLKDERGVKPGTINAALTALDHFYTHLQLGPIPSRREELDGGAPRVLDADEQRAFLDTADRRPSVRDQAIARALFDTGLRVAELVTLDLNQLVLDSGGGLVMQAAGPVSAGRRLPIPPRSQTILGRWIEERHEWRNADTTAAIFINKRGGRLSSRSIDDLIATTATHAGLNAVPDKPPVTPQVLRHTYAHRTLNSGASLEQLTQLLGHQRLDSTRRYLERLTTTSA